MHMARVIIRRRTALAAAAARLRGRGRALCKLGVASILRRADRVVSLPVLAQRVGAMLQQDLSTPYISVVGCKHERRAAIVCGLVGERASL